jgi:hypothetical protein
MYVTVIPLRILSRFFQTEFVEKIKAHALFSVTIFPKIMPFFSNVEKYGSPDRQATNGTKMLSRKDAICMPARARIQTRNHNI